MSVVLDASAVLASLWGEPGSQRVDDVIAQARMSVVNLSEVAAKLVDRGASDAQLREILSSLGLEVVSMDASQAHVAGLMRRETKQLGLSLGDRCCLALAQELGLPVLTADRAWAGVDMGIEIEVIRK